MKNTERKASSWVMILMQPRRGAPDHWHTSQCSRKAVSDVDRRSTWLTESSMLDRPPGSGICWWSSRPERNPFSCSTWRAVEARKTSHANDSTLTFFFLSICLKELSRYFQKDFDTSGRGSAEVIAKECPNLQKSISPRGHSLLLCFLQLSSWIRTFPAFFHSFKALFRLNTRACAPAVSAVSSVAHCCNDKDNTLPAYMLWRAQTMRDFSCQNTTVILIFLVISTCCHKKLYASTFPTNWQAAFSTDHCNYVPTMGRSKRLYQSTEREVSIQGFGANRARMNADAKPNTLIMKPQLQEPKSLP